MTRAARNTQGNMARGRLPILFGIALVCCTLATVFAAKKTEKTITTADGKPVRKVYIDAGTPAMANAATAQLHQDTCLTIVSTPSQADAVLQLGISLPAVAGDEAGGPDVFGSKPHAQTLGSAHDSPKRSASATCSDGKGGSAACTSSYSVQGGELPEQPAAEWPGNVGANYDVSLASPGENSQELWEPDGHIKHVSWSDQLREAAGCPVCPGEHFNPHHDKMTYQQWMQAKCPGVLTAAGNQ